MPQNSLGQEISVGGFYWLVGFKHKPVVRVDGFTEKTGRIAGILMITEPREHDGIGEIAESPIAVKINPDRLGARLAHDELLGLKDGLNQKFADRINSFFQDGA